MLMTQKSLQRKWLIQGGVGAALVGFGLCLTIEAGFLKHNAGLLWQWLTYGTCGLIVFISGLSLLIDAVRIRIQLDQSKSK